MFQVLNSFTVRLNIYGILCLCIRCYRVWRNSVFKVRFKILTAVYMKTFIWDAALCSLLEGNSYETTRRSTPEDCHPHSFWNMLVWWVTELLEYRVKEWPCEVHDMYKYESLYNVNPLFSLNDTWFKCRWFILAKEKECEYGKSHIFIPYMHIIHPISSLSIFLILKYCWKCTETSHRIKQNLFIYHRA